jgi:hypothetical protein
MERSSQLPALWDGFPEPVVKIVERLVEKFVVPQDPQCLENLEEARRLLAAASERLTRPFLDSAAPLVLAHFTQLSSFPKLGEIERAMILAAYRRSNRKPLESETARSGSPLRNRKDDALPQAPGDRYGSEILCTGLICRSPGASFLLVSADALR